MDCTKGKTHTYCSGLVIFTIAFFTNEPWGVNKKWDCFDWLSYPVSSALCGPTWGNQLPAQQQVTLHVMFLFMFSGVTKRSWRNNWVWALLFKTATQPRFTNNNEQVEPGGKTGIFYFLISQVNSSVWSLFSIYFFMRNFLKYTK